MERFDLGKIRKNHISGGQIIHGEVHTTEPHAVHLELNLNLEGHSVLQGEGLDTLTGQAQV